MTSSPDSETIKSPQRRSWLKVLFGLVAAGTVVQVGRAFGTFLLPRIKENEFGSRIDLGLITEIPTSATEPKLYPVGKFWLVNNDEKLTALHSSCTHLNCMFTWDGNKQVFICPCHGSEFSRQGEVLKGPATRNLDQFPVEILDADNHLVVSSETGLVLADIPAEKEGTEAAKLKLCVDTGRKIIGETKAVL